MQRKRVLKNLFVFLLISCVLAVGVMTAYYIYTSKRTLKYQSAPLQESYAFLKKPYCGLYGIVFYRLSDEEPSQSVIYEGLEKIDPDATMVLMEIELANYLSDDISEAALQNLEAAISTWSDNDYQIILRVAYDFAGHKKAVEPANLDVICAHINQIAPIVNEHKDSVYMMQGLFAGLWGEMHSSDYVEDEEALHTLTETLNDCIDSSVFLMVRTPQYWRMLNECDEPLTKEEAYSNSLKSRMGLYNDGMLSSVSDFGTYDEESSLAFLENHKGQGTREEELEFQNKLCLYVPNGGEVIIDNPYNDIENAVTDLDRMHVSYINSGYDLAVMDKWKNSDYHGKNGYDYIADHLGYRYVLKEGDVTEFSGFHHQSVISVTLENTGFSPAYKKFTPFVSLVNTETNEVKAFEFKSDSRTWYPKEQVTLSLKEDFSFYEDGTYDVYFCLKDLKGNYEIPCANEASYNKEIGGYYLGQICLE